jgi:hypothetical protein
MQLYFKYYGHFPVTMQICKQTYWLKIADFAGPMHPVLHVALLEPYPSCVWASMQKSDAQLWVIDKKQESVVQVICNCSVQSQEL